MSPTNNSTNKPPQATSTKPPNATQRIASHNLRSNANMQSAEAPAVEKMSAAKKKELISTSSSRIKDATSARRWLEKAALVPAGEVITTAILSAALLYLANGDWTENQDLIDGMRAVALCMDKLTVSQRSEEMREAVEGMVRETKTAVDEMMRKTEETMRKSQEKMEEVKETISKAAGEATQKISVECAGLKQAAASTTYEGHVGTQPRSYAAAASAHPIDKMAARQEQEFRDYLIREEIQRRKIIIDGIEGVKSATEGLTPKQLVEKANITLQLLEDEGDWDENTKPSGMKFITAQTLKNGGVLYEMEDEQAATWIRAPGNRARFESLFGGSVKVKARQYQIVVRFVPASAKGALEEVAKDIETDRNLDTGTIKHIKWMRDPKHWKPNQRAAHAVISVSNIEITNDILMCGAVVFNQRLKTRKLEEEPKRCYKCQRLNPGHKAAECPSKHDICPNCAKEHVGSRCTVHEEGYACATCKNLGRPHQHAAWAKACPSIIAEKEKMRARNPGMRYKYFPTDDYSTQVPRDDKDDFRVEEVTPDAEQRAPRDWYNPPGEHDNGWGGPLREAPPGPGTYDRPSSGMGQQSTSHDKSMPPPMQGENRQSNRSKSRQPIRRKSMNRSQSGSRPMTQTRINQMFSSSLGMDTVPYTATAVKL